MASVASYPHTEKPERKPARLVDNPRIRVAHLAMDYLWQGWSPEEMVHQYPHLRLAEVYSALAYYHDHRDEIDSEIRAEQELVEKLRAEAEKNLPPVVERLRALKRQQNGNESA